MYCYKHILTVKNNLTKLDEQKVPVFYNKIPALNLYANAVAPGS